MTRVVIGSLPWSRDHAAEPGEKPNTQVVRTLELDGDSVGFTEVELVAERESFLQVHVHGLDWPGHEQRESYIGVTEAGAAAFAVSEVAFVPLSAPDARGRARVTYHAPFLCQCGGMLGGSVGCPGFEVARHEQAYAKGAHRS
jgi:hypothetical protein